MNETGAVVLAIGVVVAFGIFVYRKREAKKKRPPPRRGGGGGSGGGGGNQHAE